MKGVPDISTLSNPAYYKKLNPDFHITDTPFLNADGEYRFNEDEQELHKRQFAIEGYFQSTPIIEKPELILLRKLVSNVHRAKLLPVFACVYDEFWQLLFRLRNTFTHLLQPDFPLNPDFWIWHISPGESNSGWAPHRDAEILESFDDNSFLRKDRSPRSCTIWIALTEANPYNSCIYAIPFSKDAQVQSYLNGDTIEQIKATASSAPFNFNYIRALPAKAGSILGWSPYIFHWGGLSSQWAKFPRMSIGIYMNAKDARTDHIHYFSESHQFIDWKDQNFVLPFEHRLRIIANIFSTYQSGGQMQLEENMDESFLKFGDAIRSST